MQQQLKEPSGRKGRPRRSVLEWPPLGPGRRRHGPEPRRVRAAAGSAEQGPLRLAEATQHPVSP